METFKSPRTNFYENIGFVRQKFPFLSSFTVFPKRSLRRGVEQARVSQVIKDVKLLPGQAAPRPAAVSDEVKNGTAVRTGVESRAELTFTDQTLARLGANTIFSFNEGTRNLQLGGGAMLLRVPKDAGGARINTAAVTAAITGTTILLEYHPDAYIKFIILEGTGRIFRNDRIGESVLLHAGQMLIVNPKGKGLPDPVDVDLDCLIKSSLLINGFRPLPSDSLIAREIQSQVAAKNGGELVDTNLVIFGRGTIVSLLDPTHTDILDQANANNERHSNETVTPTVTPTVAPTVTPSAPPSATPSKFGALSVITGATPYQITAGTVIKTDPSIRTNGDLDFGKIYRNQAEDGPLSTYLFTATTPFDTASRFDLLASAPGLLPIAAFKFSSLNLAGNPTINLTNKGATSLALVSVGDITSDTSGATLTFAGLKFLLLATQNGSITLGSDLSFENIPTLIVDARGQTSDLTFDSSVSGTTDFALLAQHDIKITDSLSVEQTNDASLTNGLSIALQAGGDIIVGGSLNLSTDASNVSNGGEIFLGTGGDIRIGGGFNLTVSGSAGNIDNGGNIEVGALGDITVGSIAFTLNYNNQNVSVTNGSDITLSTTKNLTTTGDNGLQMTILTPIANNLTNGGNLTLNVAGNLTNQSAGDLDLLVVTTVSTQVGQGANLSVGVGGSLLTNDLVARIENDGSGHIGTGGNLSFTVGGGLQASSADFEITTTDNGSIDRGGNVVLNVGGDFTIAGPANFLIDAENGTIGTGGNLTVSVDGTFNGDSLSAMIDSSGGGSIENGGNLIFNLGGGLTTSGNAHFGILVSTVDATTGEPEGSITVRAHDFQIGGALSASIFFGSTLVGIDQVLVSRDDRYFRGLNRDRRRPQCRWRHLGDDRHYCLGKYHYHRWFWQCDCGRIDHCRGNRHPRYLTATHNITIDNTSGNFGALTVNNLSAGGTLQMIDVPVIQPDGRNATSNVGFTPNDFVLQVGAISSSGPRFPVLLSNGSAAVANAGNNNPGNGGNVTLTITGGGLAIGAGADLDRIEANGGNFALGSTAGGNGGSVIINSSEDVTLNDSQNGEPAISATSGALAQDTGTNTTATAEWSTSRPTERSTSTRPSSFPPTPPPPQFRRQPLGAAEPAAALA